MTFISSRNDAVGLQVIGEGESTEGWSGSPQAAADGSVVRRRRKAETTRQVSDSPESTNREADAGGWFVGCVAGF